MTLPAGTGHRATRLRESEAAAAGRYPTLVRRYLATAFDLCLGFVCTGAVGLLPLTGETLIVARAIVLFVYFATYDPFLTSLGGTLGQRLLGMRVRSADAQEQRIDLLHAYVRYGVKYALGIISFFTLPFTPGQRAIHDLAAHSVMVRT